MKILLTAIGTRGDVEPFLAIGALLKAQGHEVVFLFPEQFKELAGKDPFVGYTPKFLALIESKEGKAFIGNSSLWTKIRALRFMYKEGMKVNKEMVLQQFETVKSQQPDLIVYHPKCNYPLLWGLRTQNKTVMVSPVPYVIHRVKGSAHVGFGNNRGLLNKLTYRIANFGLVKTLYDSQKMVAEGPRFSKATIRKALLKEKLVYAVSPSLFARPKEWKKNVRVLGYFEKPSSPDWKSSPELDAFLTRHKQVIFLTFGSMVNSYPEKISKLIYETLNELGYATLVNTAAGGLVPLSTYESNPNFFFTRQIPYDWVLPRVSAIIHHGGSGTTHRGLKYGCPTLLVPHIMDQYKWNELIAQRGLGPKGISINKLKKSPLKRRVQDLMTRPEYRLKAHQISEQMRKENGEEAFSTFILDN